MFILNDMKHTFIFISAVLLLSGCKGHIDGGMRADSYKDGLYTPPPQETPAHGIGCGVFNDPKLNDDSAESISPRADARRNVDAMACERR